MNADKMAIDWRRMAGGAASVATLALLALAFARLLASAATALGYPYDLDYGEGIVWQQMDNIVAGQGYAPLGVFPAIVYHYPPVYHLIVAAMIGATGIDPLAAGRLVSVLATIVAMGLAGWLCAAAQPRGRAAVVGGIAAGLAFAASPTVVAWASLMRVDMVATALTLAGLCLTVREIRAPRRMSWAAVAFALAVYTKQTAVIAPVAALATLWLVRPASAWRFLVMSVGLGLAGLGVMMAASDGGFLRHILGYNVNRVDLGRWRMIARVLGSQAITVSVAVIVAVRIVAGWGRHWRRGLAEPVEAARFMLVFYLALRVLSLPLALKSGANENYLIDLFSVAAVLLGLGVGEVAAAVLGQGRWPRALLTLLVLVGLPVQAARVGRAHAIVGDVGLRRENDALVSRIRSAGKPVVTDYMVLLRRAGKPVLFEPAIAAELAHSGLYDEAGLVRLIGARTFAFVLTQGAGKDYRERYNPAVRAAIETAYPRIEIHGEAVLRLPVSRANPAAPPRR